ncbi:MAG: hypothetical protein FWF59_04870 [Turicibacter sp.]|nr:hypothetical protein [Turicibacter sp.]
MMGWTFLLVVCLLLFLIFSLHRWRTRAAVVLGLLLLALGVLNLDGLVETYRLRSLNGIDLSQVTIAGLHVGTPLDAIDFEAFGPEIQERDEDRIWFEELILDFGDGQVSRLQTSSSVLADFPDSLGDDYISAWYDREQGLRNAIYVDRDYRLKFRIIYSDYDSTTVSYILEKL